MRGGGGHDFVSAFEDGGGAGEAVGGILVGGLEDSGDGLDVAGEGALITPVVHVFTGGVGLAPSGGHGAAHASTGGKEDGFAAGEGIVFDVGAAPHLGAAGEGEPGVGEGGIGAGAGAVAAGGAGAGAGGGELDEEGGAAGFLPGEVGGDAALLAIVGGPLGVARAPGDGARVVGHIGLSGEVGAGGGDAFGAVVARDRLLVGRGRHGEFPGAAPGGGDFITVGIWCGDVAGPPVEGGLAGRHAPRITVARAGEAAAARAAGVDAARVGRRRRGAGAGDSALVNRRGKRGRGGVEGALQLGAEIVGLFVGVGGGGEAGGEGKAGEGEGAGTEGAAHGSGTVGRNAGNFQRRLRGVAELRPVRRARDCVARARAWRASQRPCPT